MGALSQLLNESSAKKDIIGVDLNRKNLRENVVESAEKIFSEGAIKGKYKNLEKDFYNLKEGNSYKKYMLGLTALMCERTHSVVEQLKGSGLMESTVTAGFQSLLPKLVDIVRIFYPEQVAGILTDIQPIYAENGQIFVIKPKFSNTAAGVTAGQEVFVNATDGTYASEYNTVALGTTDGSTLTYTGAITLLPARKSSIKIKAGSTVVATDDGNGVISGTYGAISITGTVNYAVGGGAVSITFASDPASGVVLTCESQYDSETTPASIREMEIGINMQPVQAKQHPLRLKWSAMAQLSAAAALNLDVQDLTSNLGAQFIGSERDTFIVNLINAAAPDYTTGGNTSLLFDATIPSGGLNYSKQSYYGSIEIKASHAQTLVHQAMYRGGLSFVVAGYNAAEIFTQCPSFQSSGVNNPIGPSKIGTLFDGTVDVVRAPSLSVNTWIGGYRGFMPGDSAAILADWIPIFFTDVFNSPDLINQRGLASYYDLFVNQANYYAKGGVTGYTA